jgi:hypothetical protein
VGGSVALAYIRNRDGSPVTTEQLTSGAYEVNVGGKLVPTTLHLRSPYDPDGERIKQ